MGTLRGDKINLQYNEMTRNIYIELIKEIHIIENEEIENKGTSKLRMILHQAIRTEKDRSPQKNTQRNRMGNK